MDDEAVARAYYEAIDAGAYDDLADLLAPGFVHHRPDRTIEGRTAFVRFMREERPRTDTSHELLAVYPGEGAVAVQGRLHDADGGALFGFVDVFAVEGDCIASIRTYTDGVAESTRLDG